MRTIDITTTQNVTIEYELATLQDRMLAFFIDGVIVLAIYFFFAIGLTVIWDDSENVGIFDRFLALMPIALLMLYHLLSEILADGQSWGKKVTGVKVVRLDGKEPALSDHLLRAVFHIVDTVLSLGVLASLLVGSSNKGQRLGDMTANTTVIKSRPNLRFQLSDILKINSIENYEPTYPDVRKLKERDMLLIKSIINRYSRYPNEAHRKVVNQTVDRLKVILDLEEMPNNKIEFLKTLIRDYIVLTR